MKKQPTVYVKRSYRKLNKSYWYGDSYTWNYIILAIMTLFTVWALINYWNNKNPLVSPVVINQVKQVYAEESIKIPCEVGVAEYLECQAYKGNITHDQARILLAIGKAESGLREDAVGVNTNRTIDRGVFQINSIHKDISNKDAFDWKKNTDYAIKMMKRQGFNPWVAYKTGSYKKFL